MHGRSADHDDRRCLRLFDAGVGQLGCRAHPVATNLPAHTKGNAAVVRSVEYP